MLKETLVELYERDLNQLKAELNQYKDEKDIWQVKEGISNSAGTLVLHLLGNVKHFVGAGVGNTGYVRNRDGEFALKNISREELLADIEYTVTVVKESLGKLSPDDFEKDHPLQVGGKNMTVGHLLVFMLAHFDYHLGQINYHRRLIS